MSLDRYIRTAATAAVLLALAASSGQAQGVAGAGSAKADDLVGRVRTAVDNHDLDLFENHLIEWEGVRKRTRRLTLFQIRECFGRKIKSVAIAPLPKATPDAPLVPEGYKTSLPVTDLLRIDFDEPDHAPGETPACVFMLSKDAAAGYRMAIVLPTAPPPH